MLCLKCLLASLRGCFVSARLSLISPPVMLIVASSVFPRREVLNYLRFCQTYFSPVAKNAGAPSHLIGSAVVIVRDITDASVGAFS